jgi:hypothetical protein
MTREALIEVMVRRMAESECGPTSLHGHAYAALSALEAAGVRLVPAGDGWQPIETAPKGNGDQFESVTDPGYIAPPKILMLFEDGNQSVTHWDWYYAPGGYGHAQAQGGPAWIAVAGGELAHLHFGSPTHWRPLPKEPGQ